MLNDELEIDELLEKKFTQKLRDEVNNICNERQKIYDFLSKLQEIAGNDAIIQYKHHNGKEWLTW